MVRENPGFFGIDSGNPDLIYTGEQVNLQSMFDAAQERGIIPAEANPGGEEVASYQSDTEMSESLVNTDSSDNTSLPENIESSGFVLSGNNTNMASQIENYLNTHSNYLDFEQARLYFDSVLAEGNYDLIRENIIKNYGGDEVYIKSVGIDTNTGNQIVDFTNSPDPKNGTYFRYDMESQQFIDTYIEKPGLFARLRTLFA